MFFHTSILINWNTYEHTICNMRRTVFFLQSKPVSPNVDVSLCVCLSVAMLTGHDDRKLRRLLAVWYIYLYCLLGTFKMVTEFSMLLCNCVKMNKSILISLVINHHFIFKDLTYKIVSCFSNLVLDTKFILFHVSPVASV